MLPVPATPISPLLISAWVSNTRFLSVSKRRPMAMRLKISGGSPSMPASTMVPPLKPSLPVGDAAVGRLEMGQQRDPVRTGNDLERRDQHAPPGIPFDVHFGRIDRHRIIGRIAVDDVTGAGGDLAAEIGRQAVAAEFAFQFAR